MEKTFLRFKVGVPRTRLFERVAPGNFFLHAYQNSCQGSHVHSHLTWKLFVSKQFWEKLVASKLARYSFCSVLIRCFPLTNFLTIPLHFWQVGVWLRFFNLPFEMNLLVQRNTKCQLGLQYNSLGVLAKKWCDLNSSTGTWKWISWSSGTWKCGSFCNWAPHDDFRGYSTSCTWCH